MGGAHLDDDAPGAGSAGGPVAGGRPPGMAARHRTSAPLGLAPAWPRTWHAWRLVWSAGGPSSSSPSSCTPYKWASRPGAAPAAPGGSVRMRSRSGRPGPGRATRGRSPAAASPSSSPTSGFVLGEPRAHPCDRGGGRCGASAGLVRGGRRGPRSLLPLVWTALMTLPPGHPGKAADGTIPSSAPELLPRGSFYHGHPYATRPTRRPVFAARGRPVWVTTSRGSVKARVGAGRPGGGLVGRGERGRIVHRYRRTYDLLDHREWASYRSDPPRSRWRPAKYTRKNARSSRARRRCPSRPAGMDPAGHARDRQCLRISVRRRWTWTCPGGGSCTKKQEGGPWGYSSDMGEACARGRASGRSPRSPIAGVDPRAGRHARVATGEAGLLSRAPAQAVRSTAGHLARPPRRVLERLRRRPGAGQCRQVPASTGGDRGAAREMAGRDDPGPLVASPTPSGPGPLRAQRSRGPWGATQTRSTLVRSSPMGGPWCGGGAGRGR